MRILITGVAGFIGSNLADRLCSKGHEVVGVDNLSYGLRWQVPDGVEFHELDVRDDAIAETFKGIDTIFHLAAKNCITDCQQDPADTFDINVRGTLNVFTAAQKAGVRKIVHAESSAIYEGSSVLPTPETETAPKSFYALSKHIGHLLAQAYEEASDIKITGLRYFCAYGPRQDYRRTIPPVMSAFIMKLQNGEAPVIYGTGDKKRDFIHVDDVNDFHELCITDERTDGKVFNVGSGTNYSINEIYEHISKLLDIDIPPEHKPDFPEEAQETLADITLAKSIGWEPKINLDDGLKTMIDYLENMKKRN